LAARVGTTQSAIARVEASLGAPSLERLTELVQACGFDIDVRLVPYDDHDTSMAVRNLTLTPQERVDRMMSAYRFARAGQAAMKTAKAARGGR
jgi:transcriptional regulator with XRE-family HTH domain